MKLFFICDIDDARMRTIEIAGYRLDEHLTRNAQPSFCVGEPQDSIKSDGAALHVRADAWFTQTALAALAARLAQQTTQVVIVSAGKATVLAACLAPEQAKQLNMDLRQYPCAQALARLVDRPDCITLDAAGLDAEFPPHLVTNLLDAARIEKRVLLERARTAMLQGVRIRDPDRVSIRGELICGADVEIDVDVIIEGRVTLADGVKIGASCILSHATIGNHSRINPFSIVDHAIVGADSFVGPYGRIRPGSTLGDRVQIGNFVEIKQALVGDASRINHLAFIGDATLGDGVTIGAGVITCNHDGHGVQPTQIGSGAYVGSGTELVAPLSVGENAVIGAGSTITKDAPADKLTIARSRQVTLERRARGDPGAKQS